MIVPRATGTTSTDDDYRASKKQRTVNAALVITNSDDMRIVSDKQACREFRVARHTITLGTQFEFQQELMDRMNAILETALRRFSVVRYSSYLALK